MKEAPIFGILMHGKSASAGLYLFSFSSISCWAITAMDINKKIIDDFKEKVVNHPEVSIAFPFYRVGLSEWK